jgi:hypothetical protein
VPLTLGLQGMICNAVEKGELVMLVEMRLQKSNWEC